MRKGDDEVLSGCVGVASNDDIINIDYKIDGETIIIVDEQRGVRRRVGKANIN